MMRFLKSLARNRWVRWIFLILAGLTGYYFFREWYGEHQWQTYAAEARARGIAISVEDWGAPSIPPDEDNFAALPMWQGPPKGPAKFPPFPTVSVNDALQHSSPGLPLTDLAVVGQAMIAENLVTAAGANETDADVVLRGLRPVAPYFQQLLDGAGRSRARFPSAGQSGVAALEFPLSKIAVLNRHLDAKVCAELAAHRSDVALAHWQAGWSLANVTDEGRNLVGYLLHATVSSKLVWQVAYGLKAGAWRDEDLLAIEKRLAAENPMRAFCHALAGERTWFNGEYERMMEKRNLDALLMWTGASNPESVLLRLYSRQRRWWRANELWLNRMMDEVLSAWDPVAERWQRVTKPRFDPDALPQGWSGLDLFLARESGPAFTRLGSQVVFAHVYVRLASLGCALERHRRATGQYAEKLEDLVPKYLAKLPHEPTNGEPFRYRRDPSAGYLLYSIGIDGKDDQGAMEKGDETTAGNGMRSGPHWLDWRWWAPDAENAVPPKK